MDIIKSKQFIKELEKMSPGGIYLFLGEEEGEKEKVIDSILKKVFPGAEQKDYTLGRFHVENGEFMGAVDFAMSQSMFSDKRVCVILNIQELQKTNDNKSLLSDLVFNLPDLTLLIITSPENKIPAVLSRDMIKKMKAVQFWRYFESEIYRYLSNAVNSHNLKFEEGAAALLIELTGRDIRKIDAAIEKILDLDVRSISRETVTLLIHDEKDVTLYDFIDDFFAGKKSSFSLLKKILEEKAKIKSPELMLLGMMTRRAEMIEGYHSLNEKGLPPGEILKKLGVFPNKQDAFLESVDKNPMDNIKKIFPMIYNADYRIKSMNYSNNVIANPIFELISHYWRL